MVLLAVNIERAHLARKLLFSFILRLKCAAWVSMMRRTIHFQCEITWQILWFELCKVFIPTSIQHFIVCTIYVRSHVVNSFMQYYGKIPNRKWNVKLEWQPKLMKWMCRWSFSVNFTIQWADCKFAIIWIVSGTRTHVDLITFRVICNSVMSIMYNKVCTVGSWLTLPVPSQFTLF